MEDNLRLIIMENCTELGTQVEKHIQKLRGTKINHVVSAITPRFSNSEAKGIVLESVRGKEVFIISDINNYSMTYKMFGFDNHMSYDDHFQDIKRIICAIRATAEKIHVVMPFLYQSRQHKIKGRESLDCAMALKELEFHGVNSVITFDAHSESVEQALHCCTFDNLYPTDDIIDEFLNDDTIDINNLFVVSPDMGAVTRAKYYSDILQCDLGIYHKRRDYSIIKNGKNPVVAREYIGESVIDKNVIVIDDMIASGQTLLEVATEMKNRGAKRVYLFSTFPIFSEGEKSYKLFEEAYEKQHFLKLYTTNLMYVPEKIKKSPWYHEVNCSKQLARIIDSINLKKSISHIISDKKRLYEKITKEKAKADEKIEQLAIDIAK